jgi:hypothetical protein
LLQFLNVSHPTFHFALPLLIIVHFFATKAPYSPTPLQALAPFLRRFSFSIEAKQELYADWIGMDANYKQ